MSGNASTRSDTPGLRIPASRRTTRPLACLVDQARRRDPAPGPPRDAQPRSRERAHTSNLRARTATPACAPCDLPHRPTTRSTPTGRRQQIGIAVPHARLRIHGRRKVQGRAEQIPHAIVPTYLAASTSVRPAAAIFTRAGHRCPVQAKVAASGSRWRMIWRRPDLVGVSCASMGCLFTENARRDGICLPCGTRALTGWWTGSWSVTPPSTVRRSGAADGRVGGAVRGDGIGPAVQPAEGAATSTEALVVGYRWCRLG